MEAYYLPSLFLLTFLFICSSYSNLVIENKLEFGLECVGNFETFQVESGTTHEVFGNGRCATKQNDGNQSLVEWNFAESHLFLDISLVDACTFGAEILSNNVTYSSVRCSCVSKPQLSECTQTRLPQYCCLQSFGSALTCDIENEYYKLLNNCSSGVYKYAYDDASGLKTFVDTVPVHVLVYDDNAHRTESRDISESHRNSPIVLFLNGSLVWFSFFFILPMEVLYLIYSLPIV